jgi:K+-transporting ATPase A subunit
MNLHSALQYAAFIAIVTTCVKPLGGYLKRVFSGERTGLDGVFRCCRSLTSD